MEREIPSKARVDAVKYRGVYLPQPVQGQRERNRHVLLAEIKSGPSKRENLGGWLLGRPSPEDQRDPSTSVSLPMESRTGQTIAAFFSRAGKSRLEIHADNLNFLGRIRIFFPPSVVPLRRRGELGDLPPSLGILWLAILP